MGLYLKDKHIFRAMYIAAIVMCPLYAFAQDGTVLNDQVAEGKSFVQGSKAETLEALIDEDEDLQRFFGRNPTLMQKILASPILQREVFSALKKAENNSEKQNVLKEYEKKFRKEEATLAERKKRAFSRAVHTQPSLQVQQGARPQNVTSQNVAQEQTSIVSNEVGAPNITSNVANAESLGTQQSIGQIATALTVNGADARIQQQLTNAEEALESAERLSAFIDKVVEVRRRVIEEYFTLLETREPQAYTALFNNGALMQKILDGERTLYDTAVEVGVKDQEVLATIEKMDARIPLQKKP